MDAKDYFYYKKWNNQITENFAVTDGDIDFRNSESITQIIILTYQKTNKLP